MRQLSLRHSLAWPPLSTGGPAAALRRLRGDTLRCLRGGVLPALGLGVALLLGGAMAQPALANDHGVKRCKAVHRPSGQTLTVRIAGLRNTQGNITVVLYGANPASFLTHGGRLTRRRIPAAVGAETCFDLPMPGLYALAVYHDENNNRAIERDAQGLPSEGHGYSNNPPATAGKPDFERARIEVRPGSNSAVITMQY